MRNKQNLFPVEGVRVGERIIPVPASISPEAQAMLRAAVQDDSTPFTRFTRYRHQMIGQLGVSCRTQPRPITPLLSMQQRMRQSSRSRSRRAAWAQQLSMSRYQKVRGSEIASSSTCMAARSYSAVAMPAVRAHGCRQTGSG